MSQKQNRQTYKRRIDERIRWIAQAHGGKVEKGQKLISEREMVIKMGYVRTTIREAFAVMQYLEMITCEHGKSKIALVEFDKNWGLE